MGRTSSDMVPFLKRGLEKKLYSTLQYIDEIFGIARVKLPKKRKHLTISDQEMVKDWDNMKGRVYHGVSCYSKARQRFRQALKKSIYLEKLDFNDKAIDFRFRTTSEISEIRRKRKRSFSEPVLSPAGSTSSGYFSDMESEDVKQDLPSVLESINHDHDDYASWLDSPGKIKEEVPRMIFADSENEDSILDANSADENLNTPLNESSAICMKAFNLQEQFPSSFPHEVEMNQDTSSSIVDETEFNSLVNELFERYVLKKPFHDPVPEQMQNSGDAQEINPFAINSAWELSNPENEQLSQVEETILQSIDFEAIAEEDVKIDFSEVNASSMEEKEEVIEAEQPSVTEGICRAWVCSTPPIKIDKLKQLIFEEKVYKVSSVEYEKDFSLKSGNCNIIINQEVKEELENYSPFQSQVFGRYLFIFYKKM